MSIAFPAVVLFFLALPGIILNRKLSTAGDLRLKRGVTEEIAASLLAAVVVHLIWASLVSVVLHFAGLKIDLKAVLMLASGHYGDKSLEFDRSLKSLADYPWQVGMYLILSCVFAMWLAGCFQHLSPAMKTWLLAAEDEPAANRFRSWRTFTNSDSTPIITTINAIVEIADTAYLYTGVLNEIFPDEFGNPAYFELVSANRRLFRDDSSPTVTIPRNSFFLKWSEIITLNIQSYSLQPAEDDVQA